MLSILWVQKTIQWHLVGFSSLCICNDGRTKTHQVSIQVVNVHYMGEFADSMSGFRRRVDTCVKCDQYPISDPVLKHEPSTTPHAFFSCTLCRADLTGKREVLQTTKPNKTFMDNQLYQWEQKIRPVYLQCSPYLISQWQVTPFTDRHTDVSGLQETESFLFLRVNAHAVICLNTLRTGEADLRFYVTTVRDGWRKSAFLTRACFPCKIHLIMQYIESVSEWFCWRMFIETWPHSELTFRHHAFSV